jgi:hypothetical protein
MKRLQRFRKLSVTLRLPVVMAALMILLALVASQSVLSALGRAQDARPSETAALHVEGLSVALGPSVLRQDVWEVHDILDRARASSEEQRLLLTALADERGRMLAATDPRDLLAERRRVSLWLLFGNALATAVLPSVAGWQWRAFFGRWGRWFRRWMDRTVRPRPIPKAEIPQGDPGSRPADRDLQPDDHRRRGARRCRASSG